MQKNKLTTKRYQIGNPYPTESVIQKIPLENSIEQLNDFKIHQSKEQVSLQRKLSPETAMYGLGQNMGPINRRGRKFRMFNMQARPQTPDCFAVNGPYSFLIIKEADTYLGILIDCPSEINFDCGFNNQKLLDITIESSDLDIYLINSSHLKDVLQEYVRLTGTAYLPPKWAFGFQQSRYSYMNAEEVKTIANKFRELKIPCDAIYLDIDYMDDYKVFTVDQKPFPNFSSFVQEIQGQGFNIIPIIDPGVKIESGYSVYEDGVKNNYFCKDAEGNDYIAAVWPGLLHFPDFLREEVQNWWGDLHKFFTDLGITAFWNDMNEPEIFYSPETIKKLQQTASEMDYTAWRDLDPIHYKIKMDSYMLNSETYYPDFFHQTPEGPVAHTKLHNIYGFKMLQAASEGLLKLNPNQRYFLISRSSTIGANRLSGVWTGDNHSWWEHLKLNIQMVISLNLCGVLYCGSDIGGHCGNADEELLIRWTQLGAFVPLFRNHTEKSSRQQEPWEYNVQTTQILKDTITLRYALIDYLYSEFLKSRSSHLPFIRALFLEFNDPSLDEINDQFLCGSSLMVAPVIEANARYRNVYLPECNWLFWSASAYNQDNFQILKSGTHRLAVKLSEVPVFVKENELILLTEPEQYLGELEKKEASLVGLVTGTANFSLYYDSGSKINDNPGILNIKIRRNGASIDLEHDLIIGDTPITYQKISLKIFSLSGDCLRREITLK